MGRVGLRMLLGWLGEGDSTKEEASSIEMRMKKFWKNVGHSTFFFLFFLFLFERERYQTWCLGRARGLGATVTLEQIINMLLPKNGILYPFNTADWFVSNSFGPALL